MSTYWCNQLAHSYTPPNGWMGFGTLGTLVLVVLVVHTKAFSHHRATLTPHLHTAPLPCCTLLTHYRKQPSARTPHSHLTTNIELAAPASVRLCSLSSSAAAPG